MQPREKNLSSKAILPCRRTWCVLEPLYFPAGSLKGTGMGDSSTPGNAEPRTPLRRTASTAAINAPTNASSAGCFAGCDGRAIRDPPEQVGVEGEDEGEDGGRDTESQRQGGGKGRAHALSLHTEASQTEGCLLSFAAAHLKNLSVALGRNRGGVLLC